MNLSGISMLNEIYTYLANKLSDYNVVEEYDDNNKNSCFIYISELSPNYEENEGGEEILDYSISAEILVKLTPLRVGKIKFREYVYNQVENIVNLLNFKTVYITNKILKIEIENLYIEPLNKNEINIFIILKIGGYNG